MKDSAFVGYLHSFYGRRGLYELRNKDNKVVTKQLLHQLMPTLRQRMKDTNWDWGDGDSMDREFMREEVLEPMGYKEGESK
jgi:hypothetical protein